MKKQMKGFIKIVLLINFASLTWYACAADANSAKRNHEFKEIKLGYSGGPLCSFQYAPVYFCDDRHIAEIKEAIETKASNFNGHYILLPILERKEYYQRSLVAIDVETGVVYPLPFDFYSGDIDKKGAIHNYGRILYSLGSNRVCILGSIVAHRQIDSGKLCWDFDGAKFVGHYTPYMD